LPRSGGAPPEMKLSFSPDLWRRALRGERRHVLSHPPGWPACSPLAPAPPPTNEPRAGARGFCTGRLTTVRSTLRLSAGSCSPGPPLVDYRPVDHPLDCERPEPANSQRSRAAIFGRWLQNLSPFPAQIVNECCDSFGEFDRHHSRLRSSGFRRFSVTSSR
jgi:hypothetical protein